MALSEIFYFCTNHSGMGGRLAIESPDDPAPPIDTCQCGSLDFPASGNLVINGTNHKLLHDQIAYVGEEQKFTTGIDRITTSGTYVNSITVDFSQYPVYISHATRFTVRTLENDVIASKYVGVDDALSKIEKPIKFNNINKGIDLYNKVVLLDVESVCDYEGLDSCCDKMPSSLSISNAITSLYITYGVAESNPTTTTTTTTTTAAPPLPPTDPQRIIAPAVQYIAHPLNPDVDFYRSEPNRLYFEPNLFFQENPYDSFWNKLFFGDVGTIVYPPHRYSHIINVRPLAPDPITRNYFDAWEKKELGSSGSLFQLELFDQSINDYSGDKLPQGGITQSIDFKDRITYDRFIYDENRVQTSADSGFQGTHYFVVKLDSPTFNPLNADTGLFRYYYDVERRDGRSHTLRRESIFPQAIRWDKIDIIEFVNVHDIQFRARVIVDHLAWQASEWVVGHVSVTVVGYELISSSVYRPPFL